MDADSKGRPLLGATFTPTERGFHVYSKDLDPNTTGGVGIATRLELLPNASVRAVGQAFADVASERQEEVDVYPDGPVKLRLPIEFVLPNTNVAAQIAVSYIACSGQTCLLPVRRKIVDVQLVAR
jgi:hypothetical protein